MVTSVNPSSLRVSWQPPPEIDHNGIITGYVIEYTRSGGSSDMMTVNSGRTTRTILGLSPFVEYSVRVAAATSNGAGLSSDPEVQTSGQDSRLYCYSLVFRFIIFFSRTQYTKVTDSRQH